MKILFFTFFIFVALNLETAIGPRLKGQDFNLESLETGADHSLLVKAPPVSSDYQSKDCALNPDPIAVSRLNLSSEEPWLTGSLLAPQPIPVKKGDFLIDPYIYLTKSSGSYGSSWQFQKQSPFYTYTFQPIFYYGISSKMDVEFLTSVITNQTKGKSHTGFGDTLLALEYLLYRNDEFWFPSVKLSLAESFPTGKHSNLNPKNLQIDSTGSGAYTTTFGIVLYKLAHIRGAHFLSTNFAIDYSIGSPVRVKNHNCYGGGNGTRGKIYPGNIFITDLSFEWTFDQHWEVTLDNVYTHTNQSKFSGKKGDCDTAGSPSSEQLSFALGLGYNFSSRLALIGGVWFSALGRNSKQFQSGVLEFLWTL